MSTASTATAPTLVAAASAAINRPASSFSYQMPPVMAVPLPRPPAALSSIATEDSPPELERPPAVEASTGMVHTSPLRFGSSGNVPIRSTQTGDQVGAISDPMVALDTSASSADTGDWSRSNPMTPISSQRNSLLELHPTPVSRHHSPRFSSHSHHDDDIMFAHEQIEVPIHVKREPMTMIMEHTNEPTRSTRHE
ncbi:hypothetical protein COLO4_02710 [Corchorus olitorius]|uniref:Uncharacterized protein n=1 Tax=Corchorus olitorius TaxID=93759 RepID=A0A1R3L0K6_9ROSI|nr:hypothetical protein COLO4_02710 [Corchorus olitorius]